MFKFKKKQEKDKTKLRGQIIELLSNRIIIMGVLLMVLFCLLIYRLFVLQIIQGDEHLANFNYKIKKTIEISGARGNIYDCNGKTLAYNQLAYTVTLENTDKTSRIARERTNANGKNGQKVTENDVKNEVIYKLIKVLETNGDTINYSLPMTVNSKGKLKFTVSGSSLARFKKDIYGITNIDNLSGDEKKKAEKYLNSTPEEVYEYLRSGKNGPQGTGNMFGIADSYSTEDTLKIMSVRYDVFMNRYSQTTPITVATNISDKSIAAISEHDDEYPGVSIKADSLRKYNDAKYFSSVLGYTGVVSESELKELNGNGGKYEANDVVGKIGIEKTMESTLQGKKGQKDVLVDNLGKVIKTVKTTKASAGNNVYLTIDADLQKYAYNILERRLAGILLAHLTTADTAGSEKRVPIKDVYYALIDNNIINISKLSRKKAKTNEKDVYQIYRKKQETVLSTLRKDLQSGTTIRKNLSEEKQDYVSYIYKMLENDGILVASSIDENDQVYLDWKDEKITFRKFLRHAINNEWINISSFNIKSDYYDADEIYDELINYIVDALKSEEDFDKILYEYMIKNGNLSGKKVCLLLYDQGVLDKKKDKDYNSLYTGKMSAYNFMYKKIKNIEITPAQLALDPCSGSVVITDPDTGEVKAMVSYPSYNNNRLANGIDSSYYASLNTDLSSPMLNRATQSRTAPGSTFKPISSTAVLEEGVANASTYVKCTGIFDKISPAAKCWIYPNAHGSLNVSGAIAVSCNFFFYQMGYNLGTVNGTYNSQRGLTKLKKYASMYGFNRKSGVEITEYEPHISDEDAIRSAIGQGTHSYTPSQISRYVTSLVNHKNLIDLSLIEKTTDSSGSVITSYKKRTEEKLDIKSSTFDLIKKGMIGVVNGKDSSIKYMYEKQGMKVAGKTGTAQENKKRPNHALFISYAPYDNPDITMTVVVPNGYTSANAAEIARDIYKYYFGKASKARQRKKQQQHYCLQVQMEVMINDVLSQIQVQKDSGSTC